MSSQRTARSGDRAAILTQLEATLREVADGKLDGVAIDPGGHLFEHGYVDSLSAVLLLSHVAERYGIEVDDVDLVEKFHTLELLADHLASARE